MKVKCLSIKNPYAYLIAAGIKDVENRTWTTKYRGTIYLHASGEDAFHGYSKLHKNALPLHYEMSRFKEDKSGNVIIPDGLQFVGYDEKADEFYLTQDGEKYRREWELYAACLQSAMRNDPYMRAKAIIGTVELVDIIEDSKSPWAIKGQKHWILENAVMFGTPIMGVWGKLNLWDYPLNNNVRERYA